MALYLHVWHSDNILDGRDNTILVGVAMVSLAPLCTGFAEVDGFFHIVYPVSQHQQHSVGSAAQHGQIRVKVRPYHASFCSDSNGILGDLVANESHGEIAETQNS